MKRTPNQSSPVPSPVQHTPASSTRTLEVLPTMNSSTFHSAILIFFLVCSVSPAFPTNGGNVQLEPSSHSLTADEITELTFGSSCEDVGQTGIYSPSDCFSAAKTHGWQFRATRKSDYKDVVDGCSRRPTGEIFSTRNSTCIVGNGTPKWIPDFDGKADCECTEFQPCLCKKYTDLHASVYHYETCRWNFRAQIDDLTHCKRAAFAKGYTWKNVKAGVSNAPVDGCSWTEDNGGTLWLGTCSSRWCECSDSTHCICDNGIPAKRVRSGTCESNGLTNIVDSDTCWRAATYIQWVDVGTPLTTVSNSNLQPGCILPDWGFSTNKLYYNEAQTCKTGVPFTVGASFPIDLISSCECTQDIPCVCLIWQQTSLWQVLEWSTLVQIFH